jgi:hypothetical protein
VAIVALLSNAHLNGAMKPWPSASSFGIALK